MRKVLRRHDLLELDVVRDYFRTLYFQKAGPGALDTIVMDGEKRAYCRCWKRLRMMLASRSAAWLSAVLG